MAGVWNSPFFKYVVRNSFNRADALTSAVGAIILLIVSHIIGIGGEKYFSADGSTRAIQMTLVGFATIWIAIMLGRACWWPFHWRLEPHSGLASFLHAKLGTFMWPVVLIATGLAGFIFVLGAGVVWLSLQAISSPRAAQPTETPNTVGNPDFSVTTPLGRYRFTWPGQTVMSFYLRLDTEKNPNISNNPVFVLRNLTNTVAYRVVATWKSETSFNIEEEVRGSPKLSKAKFVIEQTLINIIATSDTGPRANFVYYVDDAPKQIISVIAKEEELYFPIQLWPFAAIYLAARIPDAIGETSPPFIARLSLDWETANGKRHRAYRVKITATNAKGTTSDMPLVDAFLNFTIEEIPQ